MISLLIKPMSAPRPRVTRHGTYMPANYVAYKKAIRMFLNKHFKTPTDKMVSLELLFYFKEIKKNKMLYKSSRPDIDNLAKGVMDALNGLAYLDDSQVVSLKVTKFYGDKNKIVINLNEMENNA